MRPLWNAIISVKPQNTLKNNILFDICLRNKQMQKDALCGKKHAIHTFKHGFKLIGVVLAKNIFYKHCTVYTTIEYVYVYVCMYVCIVGSPFPLFFFLYLNVWVNVCFFGVFLAIVVFVFIREFQKFMQQILKTDITTTTANKKYFLFLLVNKQI